MANVESEYVEVLVPKKHLTKVYGFVAALEEAAGTASPNGKEGAVSDDAWPRDLIERQYRESPDTMKRFQGHLAANPGKEYSTTEMAKQLKMPYGWNSIAGALGAYGRRVKNRYRRSSFPFQSRWDYHQGEAYHSMTPEVAEIIKAI